MSFETDLISKYSALFNGRIWHDTIPTGITRAQLGVPYCLITQVGGEERVYVDNTLSSFQNARMQFDVWGDIRIEVSAKARELRKAVLDSYDSASWLTRIYGVPVNDYDDVLNMRGCRQDFGFWYIDPIVSTP